MITDFDYEFAAMEKAIKTGNQPADAASHDWRPAHILTAGKYETLMFLEQPNGHTLVRSDCGVIINFCYRLPVGEARAIYQIAKNIGYVQG